MSIDKSALNQFIPDDLKREDVTNKGTMEAFKAYRENLKKRAELEMKAKGAPKPELPQITMPEAKVPEPKITIPKAKKPEPEAPVDFKSRFKRKRARHIKRAVKTVIPEASEQLVPKEEEELRLKDAPKTEQLPSERKRLERERTITAPVKGKKRLQVNVEKMQLTSREPGKNLSFIQEQVLIVLYKRRVTAIDAAEFFKVSRTTVYYHYRKFKQAKIVQVPPPTVAEILIEEGVILADGTITISAETDNIETEHMAEGVQ